MGICFMALIVYFWRIGCVIPMVGGFSTLAAILTFIDFQSFIGLANASVLYLFCDWHIDLIV